MVSDLPWAGRHLLGQPFFLNFEKSNNLLLLVLPFVLLYKCMNRPQRFENLVNSSGILVTDTWPYYKRTFGCSNFKGTGIENNYYLLRPIFLNSGVLVNSKRKFLLANQEHQLFEGLDYILSDQHDAITAAKFIYLPFLVEPEEGIAFLQRYHLEFLF